MTAGGAAFAASSSAFEVAGARPFAVEAVKKPNWLFLPLNQNVSRALNNRV